MDKTPAQALSLSVGLQEINSVEEDSPTGDSSFHGNSAWQVPSCLLGKTHPRKRCGLLLYTWDLSLR